MTLVICCTDAWSRFMSKPVMCPGVGGSTKVPTFQSWKVPEFFPSSCLGSSTLGPWLELDLKSTKPWKTSRSHVSLLNTILYWIYVAVKFQVLFQWRYNLLFHLISEPSICQWCIYRVQPRYTPQDTIFIVWTRVHLVGQTSRCPRIGEFQRLNEWLDMLAAEGA